MPAFADGETAPYQITVTPSVDGGYARVEDKRAISPSVSDNWQTTAGIDFAVTKWLEIGAGATFGGGETDFKRGPVLAVGEGATAALSQVLDGNAKTDSWTVFGRATITLPSNFSLGVIAGYGETEIEEFRNTIIVKGLGSARARQSWSRDTDTTFVGGNIAYTHRWGRWFAVPGVRILHTTTRGGAYEVLSRIDDPIDGTFFQVAGVDASDDPMTRGQLGSDIGYFFQSGSATIVPLLRAYWAHDFELPDGFRDRDAADLSASLNYIDGPLTIGGEFQTTVGRDETEIYGGRAYLLHKF